MTEPSRLIVGSTGSGKSEGELVDLVRLADWHDHAVVLLDGHGPLAFRAAGHWERAGYEGRMVYEPLDADRPRALLDHAAEVGCTAALAAAHRGRRDARAR